MALALAMRRWRCNAQRRGKVALLTTMAVPGVSWHWPADRRLWTGNRKFIQMQGRRARKNIEKYLF